MKSVVKSILLISLFITNNQIIFAQEAENEVTITVSGSGKTQEEAKQSALRSAIEQAFGAFISSKTEVFNDPGCSRSNDFCFQWKHYPYLKRTEPVN